MERGKLSTSFALAVFILAIHSNIVQCWNIFISQNVIICFVGFQSTHCMIYIVKSWGWAVPSSGLAVLAYWGWVSINRFILICSTSTWHFCLLIRPTNVTKHVLLIYSILIHLHLRLSSMEVVFKIFKILTILLSLFE